MNYSKIIETIIPGFDHLLTDFDKRFVRRVYSTPVEIYENRLKAISFTGHYSILDAGCGFGQWSIALAQLNHQVHAIDTNKNRIRFLQEICKKAEILNITAEDTTLETTGFQSSRFNAIFCYSVLYLTNYRKTIAEMSRILMQGGKLYICSNGIGWYIHNIIGNEDSTLNDTRQMGIDAITNTVNYLGANKYDSQKQLITPGETIVAELEKNGFASILYEGEGKINVSNQPDVKSFFLNRYYCEEGVYEIIAEKK